MTIEVSDRARVLVEALPYIRRFHGQTVVVKVGGNAIEQRKEETLLDVVLLRYVGMLPVLVHGGGPEITHYMERLGLPVEFVDGLRVSDASTVEIAKMVLVGKVNKEIVLRLGRHGAVGGDHTQIGRPDLVQALHQRLARGLLGVDLHGHKAGGDRVDHLGV